MNPYESNPERIPAGDLYADLPSYGRYLPRHDDFCVDATHIRSLSTASLQYWASVLECCNESNRIYPAFEGGRDVFALGGIIVKSGHLHHADNCPTNDYSYADANEEAAIDLARTVLKGVSVPEILFNGKINGHQVLVQQRLPGVTLNVAWPYLSQDQKESFKQQAREILQQLNTLKPTDGRQARSYIVPDPNIGSNGRIDKQEQEILFSEDVSAEHDNDDDDDGDMGFMHNDLTPSNCIVDCDKIVGLIDWEMAGFFGWDAAAQVHRRVRSPQREHYVNANLSESKLQEIMSWNDLYDV